MLAETALAERVLYFFSDLRRLGTHYPRGSASMHSKKPRLQTAGRSCPVVPFPDGALGARSREIIRYSSFASDLFRISDFVLRIFLLVVAIGNGLITGGQLGTAMPPLRLLVGGAV